MCNNCYHSNGRDKKAWKCEHTKKSHYALGICQNCYQSRYMSKTKKYEKNINTESEPEDYESQKSELGNDIKEE